MIILSIVYTYLPTRKIVLYTEIFLIPWENENLANEFELVYLAKRRPFYPRNQRFNTFKSYNTHRPTLVSQWKISVWFMKSLSNA